MDLRVWEDGEVIWSDTDEKFILKPQYDWNECFISFPISNYNRRNTSLPGGSHAAGGLSYWNVWGLVIDSVACSHPNHLVLEVLLIVKVTLYVCNYTLNNVS